MLHNFRGYDGIESAGMVAEHLVRIIVHSQTIELRLWTLPASNLHPRRVWLDANDLITIRRQRATQGAVAGA